MKDDIRLAAVGDNCIDLYDQTGDAYPGGNPVNVAVYTVRLGGSASYTGVVGDDKYGRLMRQAVAAKGVDVSHLHTEPGSTALSHVTVVNGDRVFGDYEEGVMENFRLTEEDVDFLCGHDLVVSGLWGRVEGDLPRLKTRGVPVAFDCANRPEDPAAEKALPWVDYAFFSNDSAGDRELEDILRAIHTKGPELVVATRGERGSLAFDGSRFYRGASCPARWWTPWAPETASLPASSTALCGGRTSQPAWPWGPKTVASPWAMPGHGKASRAPGLP